MIPFGEKYQFSQEEIELLDTDDNAPPYPDERKNKKEYELFELNGYVEIGESRLICLELQ